MTRPGARLAVYTAAALVLAVFLAPIAWIVVTSLKTRAQIFAWPPLIWHFAPTWQNYRDLFAPGATFPHAMLNSLVAAGAATLLALAIGLPAAYALVGRRVRRARSVRTGVLLIRMIPPVALLLPYYLLFRATGLLGTLAGIAIVHVTFCVPVVVWTMRESFAGLPGEVEEAARIDGATPWQVFRLIALPMVRATIAASAIFSLLTSWNEFLFAVSLSRLPSQTVPVAIMGYVGDVYTSWGQLAAATVLGLLPALALAFAGQRWLLAGMAPGAIK